MKSRFGKKPGTGRPADPASAFARPMDVIRDETLSDDKKIEILQRWEYDVREAQVAEEEGFAPGESGVELSDILDALHQLGVGPDVEHSPPTKQGGI